MFVPTGQPTDQNFGAHRPGSNLYSSSLIALQASTGKLKWFYSHAPGESLDFDEVFERILVDVSNPATSRIAIDVESMTVRSHSVAATFSLSERHRHMFLHGLDMIGATLARWAEIDAFQQAHWKTRPWLRDVAATTRARLAAMTPGSSL